MWIPPDYMKNEEGRKPDDSKAKEGDKYQFDTSNCNGWLPVDINRLGSLKQDGDERKTEQQENEDKNRFPFPLFWMPYKPEEVERDDYKKSNDGKETRMDFGVNPIKLPDNDDRKSQCRSHEGNYASQVGLKTVDGSGVKKVIPVKQAEHHQEKNISKDKESARGIIVEQIKENGGKKSSENTSERQSNSPTKISKLPPVCLRVDPLPRRKDHVKKRKALDSKRETNTIEVMEGTSKDEVEDCNKSQIRSVVNLPVDSHEEVSNGQNIGEDGTHCEESFAKEGKGMGDTKDMNRVIAEVKNTTGEGESDDGECEIGEHKELRIEQEEKMDKVNKVEKRFSDAEAAILIQAAYRGFEVRRWEPLKKLKQIAKIIEQIPELKRRIQACESSSDICTDDRQRVGLHPSVRDIRKSVARELVTLQERLDVLANASAAKPVVDLSSNTRDDACIEQPKEGPEAKVGPGNNLPERGHEPLPMAGAMSESEAMESSNVIVAGKETCGDFEKKTAQLPVQLPVHDDGDTQIDSQLLVVNKDEHKHVMSDCCDLLMSKKTEQNHEVTDPEPSVELPVPLAAQEEIKSAVEVTGSSLDVDPTLKDKSADMIGFTELPQEVLDRDPEALASESIEQIDLGKDTDMQDVSPLDIG
ncbi:hypothetical protein RJ639_043632 [Escallonia herrerae]|uniref:BAG domain-containing protein n=1 Tax=Escallonia herrerae TaxID=1293975 RepID=A0AA89B8F1_9ASTE|nr:hypothetical protein RJ639_043632 [Escallonia herrerae]